VSTELLMGQDSSILIHVLKAANLTEIRVFFLNLDFRPEEFREDVLHIRRRRKETYKNDGV